jgi:hypothetical protein
MRDKFAVGSLQGGDAEKPRVLAPAATASAAGTSSLQTAHRRQSPEPNLVYDMVREAICDEFPEIVFKIDVGVLVILLRVQSCSNLPPITRCCY